MPATNTKLKSLCFLKLLEFDIANTLAFVYVLFETFHFIIFELDIAVHSSTLHYNISH